MTRRWGTLTATAAVVVGACAQILGTDGYQVRAMPASDASSARCGGFEDTEPQCEACLQEKCCDEGSQCREDSGPEGCAAVGACLGGCHKDDGKCLSRCYETPKTPSIQKYVGCMLAQCGAPCSSAAGFGAPFGEACANCVVTAASADATACLSDRECAGYVGCTAERCATWEQDPQCRVSCSSDYPAFADKFWPYALNVTSCSAQCGWGSHWNCANPEVALGPFNPGGQTQVTLTVTDPALGAVVDGVSVSTCPLAAVTPCSTPVITDTAGVATLLVDRTPASAQGFNAPYFRLSHPERGTVLIFPGRTFIGEKARVSLWWLDVTAFDQTSDAGTPSSHDSTHGMVFVSMGDCTGGFDVMTTEGNTSFRIEGGPEAEYGLLPGSTASSGGFGHFLYVRAGFVTLHGFDQQGRQVASADVLVEGGATTVVYLNYPVVEY